MTPNATSNSSTCDSQRLARVCRAPDLVGEFSGQSVFLAGSIEGGPNPWQVRITQQLAHCDVTIFDPRRDDWDSTWIQRKSDDRFQHQIEWELAHQERADLVAVYLHPGTEAPVSLLETGLATSHRKAIVCCPDGFWRKKTVKAFCELKEVPLVESLDELAGKVMEMLERLRDPGMFSHKNSTIVTHHIHDSGSCPPTYGFASRLSS